MNLCDSPLAPWKAHLSLGFAQVSGRTSMISREHYGPLVVQRPLYPEGPEVCQVLIIHPPGGIAGGDELQISCQLDNRSVVQMTTPGATKWYESFGREASQSVKLAVSDRSVCEWIPQENIVFDKAALSTAVEVHVDKNAIFFGWEFTALGRHRTLYPYEHGDLKQSVKLFYDGDLVFRERAHVNPNHLVDGSPILNGQVSYGSMYLVGVPRNEKLLDQARLVSDASAHCGVTWMDSVFVARWVGNNVEDGRRVFEKLWCLLRPYYFGKEPVPPRIWST
ncbi:MAG: urease accessory protein UreD [Betaproteobacteria bacterium]